MSDKLVIEKLMSLSRDEFIATLAMLTGERNGKDHAEMPVEGGRVLITFRPEPPATLGKLLSLPRATVTLTFENVPDTARTDFLALFERRFQRGGG